MTTEPYIFGRGMVRDNDPDTDASLIWDWLFDRATLHRYDGDVPPYRPPERQDTAKRLVVCEWSIENVSADGVQIEGQLYETDGAGVGTAKFRDNTDCFQAFQSLILRGKYRGAYCIFQYGARLYFHHFLRKLAPYAIAAGYTVKPVCVGTEIKCIIISNGGHSWTLTDPEVMLGVDLRDYPSNIPCQHTREHPSTSCIACLHEWLSTLQDWMLRTFNIGLRPTIGSVAIRAASRFIGPDDWLWRPLPIAISLCRDGCGFRGGYLYAEPFAGNAYHADISRAYTWGLAQPLPSSLAIGPCVENGIERDGIYLCELSATGTLPAYISAWKGRDTGFRRAYFKSGATYTVLPSSEFGGLRALGFTVAPGFGVVFTSRMSLAGYVNALGSVLRSHGRRDIRAAIAKRLGNAVYGKLAESDTRVEVIYSGDDPGKEWYPYITVEGQEVPYLWERDSRIRRAYHHIDVATAIAGSVRTRLLQGVAMELEQDNRAISVDTDGAWFTRYPATLLTDRSENVGAWRGLSEPSRLVSVGRRFRREGDKAKHAGFRVQDVGLIEMIAQGQEVTVSGIRLRSPFERGEISREVQVTLRGEF